MYSKSLDIIAITESWLSKDIILKFCLLLIPFSAMMDICWVGGSNCSLENCTIIPISHFTHCLIAVTLHTFLTFFMLYDPPSCSSSAFHEINHCLESIPHDSHIVLLDDLNLPDVNWSTLTVSSEQGDLFCATHDCLNLVQLISAPAHQRKCA